MVPLVYVQRGWFQHFELAVRSARRLHPETEIVHIGDRRYLPLKDVCDFVSLGQLNLSQINFESIYQHHSPNTVEFERFCIERWFALRQLMHDRDWQRCWVFDSDTLLFANFEIIATSFGQHGITINQHSPHATFIANRNSLDRFCDWVIDLYANHAATLPGRITNLGWGVPGISDMTLLTDFGNEVEPIGDNSLPTEFGLIDNNIAMPQGVVCEGGRKLICRRKGVPYVEDLQGNLVALNLIHFQGASKRLMPDFAEPVRSTLTHQFANWTTKQSFQIDKRWQRLGNSLGKRLPFLSKNGSTKVARRSA